MFVFFMKKIYCYLQSENDFRRGAVIQSEVQLGLIYIERPAVTHEQFPLLLFFLGNVSHILLLFVDLLDDFLHLQPGLQTVG